jgi:hypothetical protein
MEAPYKKHSKYVQKMATILRVHSWVTATLPGTFGTKENARHLCCKQLRDSHLPGNTVLEQRSMAAIFTAHS